MKELIRKSDSCKKGMLVKFVNNTYYLNDFDEFKQWLSEEKPDRDYYIFDDDELESNFTYRNDAMTVNNVFYKSVLSIHKTPCRGL